MFNPKQQEQQTITSFEIMSLYIPPSVHKTSVFFSIQLIKEKRQMLSGLEAFLPTMVSLWLSQQAGSKWTQILSDKTAELIT